MTQAEQTQQLKSSPCRQAQLESPVFQEWGARVREKPFHMHRKIWEYAFISQALHERGMLEPGRRGLGFAVGMEPLPALFASLGCEILATDLATEEARRDGWVDTGQHASSLAVLNSRGICPPADFEERVQFRFVDMRAMPADLGAFDFLWSTSSLEHLGSLGLSQRFILDSLRFLKPGGVSIHTTEYNVTSNFKTMKSGSTVLFRKRDLKRLARKLRRRGYRIELDFTDGDGPLDTYVDRYPYRHDRHLKFLFDQYTVTSYGLIIES